MCGRTGSPDRRAQTLDRSADQALLNATAPIMLRQAGSLLLRLPGGTAAQVLQQQAGALAQAVSCLQGTVSNAAQQDFTTIASRFVCVPVPADGAAAPLTHSSTVSNSRHVPLQLCRSSSSIEAASSSTAQAGSSSSSLAGTPAHGLDQRREMSLRYARNMTPTKDQYARRCVCVCVCMWPHARGGCMHSHHWGQKSSVMHTVQRCCCSCSRTGRGAWSAQAALCETCWVCWGSAVGSHRAVWRYKHRPQQLHTCTHKRVAGPLTALSLPVPALPPHRNDVVEFQGGLTDYLIKVCVCRQTE